MMLTKYIYIYIYGVLKIFFRNRAPTSEEQHANHHDVDRMTQLTDAITALSCDSSLIAVTCEARPPMEKINGTF